MTPPLHLVACTKAKRPGIWPARELYAASDWFRKARHYVERQGAPWRILSAEHGLVEPDQLLGAYETSLTTMRRHERDAWAWRVYAQLEAAGLVGRPTAFLAGELYREPLGQLLAAAGEAPAVPMRGLGLGEQKAWLAWRAAQVR